MSQQKESTALRAAADIDRGLQVVTIETDNGPVTLTPSVVRRYLVHGDAGGVTDQDIVMFLGLCKFHGLNPFLREAYLIKYKDDAQMVVAKEVYTARAQENPDFEGFRAGVIVWDREARQFHDTQGVVPPGREIIGGWAELHMKGWKFPHRVEVNLEEYIQYKGDGQPNKMWKQKKGTMIRKVALMHALREAMPRKLRRLYAAEEFGIDSDSLPSEAIDVEPPPAAMASGQAAPAKDGGAEFAQEDGGSSLPKRVRKHKFSVDEKIFGVSELSTCGVTPATLLTIRKLSVVGGNAQRIKDFMASRVGYSELSFLRSEEAEEVLSSLDQPPLNGGPPPETRPSAPKNGEAVKESAGGEMREYRTSSGTVRTVECSMHEGREVDVEQYCMKTCSTRAEHRFCPILGEKAPEGGFI